MIGEKDGSVPSVKMTKEFTKGDVVIVYSKEKRRYYIGEVYRKNSKANLLGPKFDYIIAIEDDEYPYLGTSENLVQSYKCDCGRDKMYLDRKEEWGCIECD